MTKLETLLSTLADGKWKSNTHLVQVGVGYRYGSEIEKARRRGANIESRRITNERWEYRLLPGVRRFPHRAVCEACGQFIKVRSAT